jgi:Reverse transcriptase (RNA-dependent DNA polymerase)
MKAIYGLVHAASQWWKKVKEVMATCDFCPSKSDPCHFIKKTADGEPIFFVCIYVDEGRITETQDAIKEVISALCKVFKVKTMAKMEKFVGCHIIDRQRWCLDSSTKVIEELKENFNNILGDTKRIYTSPSAPKTLIVRPKEGDPLL